MLRTPDAARRHVDRARIGLGASDQLGNGLHRKRRVASSAATAAPSL
jgi:hypothetical protein